MAANLYTENPLIRKLKSIEIFVFDMDGVLTDGSLMVMEAQTWYRKMSVKDGYAIQLAARSGYTIILLSGSDAPPVRDRMKKLSVSKVYFNVHNKKFFLTEYFKANSIDPQTVLYMGDDIPDLEVMQLCGLSGCPSDAVAPVRKIADIVSRFKGGEGCARDVIEKVMKLRGDWKTHTEIPST